MANQNQPQDVQNNPNKNPQVTDPKAPTNNFQDTQNHKSGSKDRAQGPVDYGRSPMSSDASNEENEDNSSDQEFNGNIDNIDNADSDDLDSDSDSKFNPGTVQSGQSNSHRNQGRKAS